MFILFFIVISALLCTVWIRSARANRERWVARLQLPGMWVSDGDHPETLDLAGGLASGTYRSSDLGHGQWRLSGHVLVLRSSRSETQEGTTQERRLDLAFHDVGRIALELRPGERRIYKKQSGNVIPLKRRTP